MVAGKRGRPRKIVVAEGDPAKEPQPAIIVKTEPRDGLGPSSSQAQPVTYVPAPGEIVSGYDEEPEEEDGSSEIIVDVVDEGTTVYQTAREIFEPSPIERRLRENRIFNEGDWSSAELKSLYDGITTYGTTEEALEVIQENFCPTRNLDQVMAKVEEIRALNAEHKEDRLAMQVEQWVNTGYRDVTAVPQYVILPFDVVKIFKEVSNWEAAIQRVNRQIRSHSDYPVRAAIEAALETQPKDAESPTLYKVTDYRTGRGYGKEQPVSWQRLGTFFAAVVRHARPLPPLNPLECAIALKVVDDVEEEVVRTLTDEHKAVIRGWLANIQMRHLRDFAPDTPYSTTNAVAVLLDPLRTRLWNIPRDASALPEVIDEEQLSQEAN
ncbi:hypothetical protein NECAME_12458 [Necator americanus]|uniref:Uncharacterized protein n=1 Tax=Necator americanus TaxID=51031 RepID=W2T299_NECAM|nr:hypothetical protein NECAME_12458 [Necator americanus]ETN75336.1 hypothetical protein NECAME_12458 [Necator americanus]